MIASFAIIAWWEVTRNLRFANIIIGLWLIISPWVLGYESTASINNNVVGILIFILSLIKGKDENKYGGGWISLFRK